ncbi:MAG: hypothetical protein QM784_39460 [Polyangiaceae bacterium]
MPSLEHETLRLLFQNRPELAPALLRDALGVELPAYSSVRVESADLTDIVPAEYRADLVVLLVDGKPVLAIVVEVQLAQDERKLYTWPVYVVGLRARFSCPSVVLVVTSEASVARWANRAIAIGPGATLRPWVIGPDAVPLITNPQTAEAPLNSPYCRCWPMATMRSKLRSKWPLLPCRQSPTSVTKTASCYTVT